MTANKVDIFSEPYAASGNIGDGGLKKLLGAPALSILNTLIRETVQNSCDAALPGLAPTIKFRIRTLTKTQISFMKDEFFRQLPKEESSIEGLESFLNSKSPRVMEISDFNTKGLNGPTRADLISSNAKENNFVEFLRNVGTNRHTSFGGGTYGFGKVSLYKASKCSTIIVDTATQYEGKSVKRLMGCHLGLSHQAAIRGKLAKYTGRHWWGVRNKQRFVDPIEGSEASTTSAKLGFPKRLLKETGTSIMILDPYFGEEHFENLEGLIQEALLWYFWPRLTKDIDETKKITFEIEIDGKCIELPLPENFPPLDLYCRAIKNARAKNKNSEPIYCQKPSTLLGQLAISKGWKAIRTPLLPQEASVIPAISSHIAVMRPIELVVKYYKGEPLSNELMEWAGVFIADDLDSTELAFAKSEPPAHDDWEPSYLEDRHEKKLVNVAVREIKLRARNFSLPISTTGLIDEENSLASVADKLGSILHGTLGDGAGRKKPPKTDIFSKSNTVSQPIYVRLYVKDNLTIAVFESLVRRNEKSSALFLNAKAYVAIDGSPVIEEKNDFLERPDVLQIEHIPSGIRYSGGTANIQQDSGIYQFHVKIPNDCAVILRAYLADKEIA